MLDSGIYRLQQEAARRVRLMEERNRRIADSYASDPRLQAPCPPAYTPPEARRPAEAACVHTPPAVVPPARESSEDDSERLLLLLLALLLAKSGAHMELIVALLYLAM